jgi:hypothetical protein
MHTLFIVSWCALAITATSASPNYVESGNCAVSVCTLFNHVVLLRVLIAFKGEQQCRYFYSAQQEFTNSGEEQRTSVNATVDINCISSVYISI